MIDKQSNKKTIVGLTVIKSRKLVTGGWIGMVVSSSCNRMDQSKETKVGCICQGSPTKHVETSSEGRIMQQAKAKVVPGHLVLADGDKMVLCHLAPHAGFEAKTSNSQLGSNFSYFAPLLFGDSSEKPFGENAQNATAPSPYYFNQGLNLSGSEDQLNSTTLEEGSIQDDPPSSTPQEKSNMFRSYLSVISSCVYAVFIVTLGVVVYITDLVLGYTPMAESFSIYLVAVGLVYFLYLYFDIRRYMNEVNEKKERLRIEAGGSGKEISGRDGPNSGTWSCNSSDLGQQIDVDVRRESGHDYCFSTGRHSGSFYLKCGAAGFCFGHLIHSGLLMGYQIVFLTSDNNDFYGCASVPVLILDIMYPIYSFFQLFFIFKYSNVIINRCKEMARFALMHCIASSICFWVWTILRETMDSLHYYASKKQNDTAREYSDDISEEPLENIVALPLVSFKKRGAEELLKFLSNSSQLTNQCLEPQGITLISKNFSPYLYPFTIEYSILVVGILFIIWQNIGNCESREEGGFGCRLPPSDASNVVIHADCHSANKGLFAGLIVLVMSVVSIILFCVAIADSRYVEVGLTVNVTSELTLLLLMTVTVILAYRKVTQLDVNLHPISLLDDLLLFICIPAFFLYAIFSIVPAVAKHNYLSITRILLQVIQVLLQTPFIIDGLRRCSNSRALRLEKPGRELVTFLIVCNVAMWVTETFEIKSHDIQDDRYDVYGKVMWTIVSHMTVPLTMFYRFHSSVCLADIWKSAYERGP